MKKKSYIIIIVSALFFFYEFYLRITLGSYQTEVMNYLNLNFKEFSLLSTTIFCLTYGFMQIPVGIIINKYKLRKTMSVACLLCTISCFGFFFVSSFFWALFWRFVMALGASFGFLSHLLSLKNYVSKKNIAFIIGISFSISTIFSVCLINFLVSKTISKYINWKLNFFLSGCFGIFLLILINIFTKNTSKTFQSYKFNLKSLLLSFNCIQTWAISLISSYIYFIIEYFTESNGRVFLYTKNINKSYVPLILISSWIGYSLGNPLLGYISDFYNTRKKIIIFCCFLGLISVSTIIFYSNPIVLIISFMLLGISASGQSIGYASINDIYTNENISIGFAIDNAMITVVSIFISSLIGYLLDILKVNNSLYLAYQYSFQIFIVIYIFVLVSSFLFLKEKTSR